MAGEASREPPRDPSADARRRHRRGRCVGAAIAIAAVACLLRGWRISWGLDGPPGHLGFPDEGLVWVPYIASFIPLSWHSFEQLNLNYPTLYGYAVGMTGAVLHGCGLFTPSAATLTLFHAGREPLLVARFASVAASLAAVALTGIGAARMYSASAALFAASLAAVVPFDVAYAHVASLESLLTALTVLAVLLAYGAARDGSALLAAAAGIAAGAATATKYTGLSLVVVVGAAAAEVGIRERSVAKAGRLLLAGGCGFAVGFSLACPPCVLHADRMMAALRNHWRVNTELYAGLHNAFRTPNVGWHGRPYVYELVASLPFVLGWPLYLLALYGVVVAMRRHELGDRVMLAMLVPYFVVIGRSTVVYPRYLLTILPLLVMLAGRALATMRSKRTRIAVWAVVWIYSAVFAASQVSRMSLRQQDDVAQWIAQSAAARHLPGPVRVGVPLMMLDYFRLSAPLAAAKLRAVDVQDGHWFDQSPEFFVLPEWYAIAIRRDMPDGEAGRDLDRLLSGAAPYDFGARWRSGYLQRAVYTALDPAFAGDLWQGEIGFSVYVRRDASGG